MIPTHRLGLIASIARGRVLAGERVAPKVLPPIIKMKTIPVDKKVKSLIIHSHENL